MKKVSIFLILLFTFNFYGYSQDEKQTFLAVFENLSSGKWSAEGQWEGGRLFKQEIEYEMSLNDQLVKVKVYGSIDEKETFGLRNGGIRMWDNNAMQMRFWEFDIFGGITEGFMGLLADSFYYQYDYPDGSGGITTLRDVWTKKTKDAYGFRVESIVDGKSDVVYLRTEFKRVPQ